MQHDCHSVQCFIMGYKCKLLMTVAEHLLVSKPVVWKTLPGGTSHHTILCVSKTCSLGLYLPIHGGNEFGY